MLVVAVDCVIVVVTLLVLVRRVVLRAVSSCCRAAWACRVLAAGESTVVVTEKRKGQRN